MEDSTAMTIEFLRARLLSERSVSRTARQRANDLAKRVVELEEHLRIVTLQRKKAEKATTEVLAILENQGISDFSEEFDSSSEQDGVLCESKEDNHSTKEEESSVASRSRENDADEFSGSELECLPVPGRSLSWKMCSDVSNSLENNYIDQARRRKSSSASTGGSSSKQHMGKSCRQIKQRETRSTVDEARDESIMLDAQENRVSSRLEDVPNSLSDGPEILSEGSTNEEDKVLLEGLVSGSLGKQRNVTNVGPSVDGSRRDTDMERALEQQAQLIGRYEAEENAQREWEEKFRENNSCSPDSCEPGNRSDITEERNEIKAEVSEPAEKIASHDPGAKSEAEDVCRTEALAQTIPVGFLPAAHVDVGCFRDQQFSGTFANESPPGFPEFAFPGQEKLEANTTGKKKQEWLENNFLHSPSRDSPGHLSVQNSSSHVGGSSYQGESSGRQNELHALTLHETANGLGAVLEALQRAKLSLKHEFNRLPLSRDGEHAFNRLPLSGEGGPMGKAIGHPLHAIKAGDALEIPVGCAGLFRVPTDLQFEATPQANFMDSSSGSSLTRYYPDMRVGVAAGDRYTTSPSLETGSRVSSWKPYFDPYLDTGMGLPASSGYAYPSYADLIPQMPSEDGFPRSLPSMEPRMSTGNYYSFGDDQIRPYMRR